MLEFGELRIFLLFPFLHPIFCYIKYKFENKIFEDLNKLYILKVLLILISIHFSLIFQLISEIISKIRRKRKQLKISISMEKKQKIYNEYSIFNYKVILLILFKTILLYSIFVIKFQNNNNNFYLGRFYIMFSLAIWSYFIIGINMYNHQILSLLIISLGTIFFLGINIFINNEELNIFLIYLFLFYCLFCLNAVIKKFIVEKYYISPFLLLFLEGMFGLVIDLTLAFIFYHYNFFSINDFFLILKIENIFPLCIYIISLGITQMFIMITIYYFNPTMVGVCDYLSVFFEDILFKFQWYQIIGYILIISGCFIYNEIIILHFCNLEKDTKKYLEKRGDNFDNNDIVKEIFIESENNLNNNILLLLKHSIFGIYLNFFKNKFKKSLNNVLKYFKKI